MKCANCPIALLIGWRYRRKTPCESFGSFHHVIQRPSKLCGRMQVIYIYILKVCFFLSCSERHQIEREGKYSFYKAKITNELASVIKNIRLELLTKNVYFTFNLFFNLYFVFLVFIINKISLLYTFLVSVYIYKLQLRLSVPIKIMHRKCPRFKTKSPKLWKLRLFLFPLL